MTSDPSAVKSSGAKFKRKLTPFICQELLYDYVMGRLDADRTLAVETFLTTDQASRDVLEAIRVGTKYADDMAAMGVQPEFSLQLSEAESAISLGRKYSSWSAWPETLRWSLTALLVSAMMATVVAVIPWSRLSFLHPKKSDTVELAALSHGHDGPADMAQEAEPADQGSGDEEIEAPDKTAPGKVEVPGAKKPPIAVAINDDEASSGDDAADDGGDDDRPGVHSAAAPVANPIAKPIAAAKPVESAPAKEEPLTATESTATPTKTGEAKPKGFVYRAFMTLANLDDLGPKITDNIKELGGTKAGEVELGWKRGTGRYYHFALPSDNEEKLLEQLRAYGPVRISKDPHPRVMPQGQVRFILWVESSH